MNRNCQYRQTSWIAWSSAALGLLVCSASPAQEDSADVDDENELVVEEVLVTGTRIKRRDFSSPSPLVTVSREDIVFSGQPTLDEYLKQLPQVQPSTGRAHNNGSDGTATLDLRGLGPGRTLVLLNGRRVAPSGTGSAIDVNNLPSTLIDRVEIITGGASTVYGSDAISGVANFITRDDFLGLSIETNYNITAEGDAEIWDANVVYGLDLSNGGHLTFYGGHYEREELFASERPISSIVLSENWFTGELDISGSPATPAGVVFAPNVDLGGGVGRVTWDPDGTPRNFVDPDDRYNFAPVNYLQTPLTRDTFGVLGEVPISDRWEGYFEASYAKNESAATLAPPPFFGVISVNLDNPLLTPETRALFSTPEFAGDPGFAAMFFGLRLSDLGPRIIARERDYSRFLGGIRGSVADGWDLDAWVTYTDAEETERYFNDGSFSRFLQGLLVDPATGQCFDPSNGCVPINPFGPGNFSQEAADFIRVTDIANLTQRKQSLASVVVTGSPFEIWSGPVEMAFGAEWRRDQASYTADEQLFTGDTIGFRGDSPVEGTETVYELYSEAIFTLFEGQSSGQRLEAELGGRWSNYDNAGSVTTWKAGLNWDATESLRFRAMTQHAVRAPNNQELFQAQFSESDFFVGSFSTDPCSASSDPVGRGIADRCIQQGLAPDQVGVFEATPFYPTEFIFGGNPELEPEASDTLTVGAVFNPVALPGLTMSIDYYDLEVEDTIGQVDPGIVCFDPLNTQGVFCDNLERDATGNVVRVTQLIQNRGLQATEGVDVQARYLADLPASWSLFGGNPELSIHTTLTHVISLELQENPVSEVFECEGIFGFPCAGLFSNFTATYPENRVTTNIHYSSGPFSSHLTWRWIDGVDNGAPLGSGICCGIPDPMLAIPTVSSYNYFDLGLSYEWDRGVLVRFGINNLTDKNPPQMASQQNENNTDAIMYDVFGRTYYLNLRFQFGG